MNARELLYDSLYIALTKKPEFTGECVWISTSFEEQSLPPKLSQCVLASLYVLEPMHWVYTVPSLGSLSITPTLMAGKFLNSQGYTRMYLASIAVENLLKTFLSLIVAW